MVDAAVVSACVSVVKAAVLSDGVSAVDPVVVSACVSVVDAAVVSTSITAVDAAVVSAVVSLLWTLPLFLLIFQW